MAEKKATIDEVRNAMDELRKLGVTASAAKIRGIIGGGSQTTILEARRAVFAERSAAGPDAMPIALLQAVSEPLIKKIWDKAQEMANRQSQSRIDALLGMQESLNDDVQDYEDAGANARQRIALLESQVIELEGQLASRGDLGSQIDGLTRVLGQMRGDPADETDQTKAAPARMIVLLFLAERRNGASNPAIDRMVMAAGYSQAAAQKARWHVENEGYVAAVGEGLVLTRKGRDKLQPPARTTAQ
jgi:hypothetical protein